MAAGTPPNSNCPLAGVDRRLEDVHRLWHQAEQSYFLPEEFRLAAQNAIQTLRTVTFILQKHKDKIPDFDTWYAAWQERMRADSLMRWMIEARNKIEKQGDLESNSFIRAELIASHLEDECPVIEVPAHLFDNPEVLLKGIPLIVIEKHILKHGALSIKRRWVENSLPQYELLDAIAIAYGRISELVEDAHRQMSLPIPVVPDCQTGRPIPLASLGWRMPCMIGHDEPRALVISLEDGATLNFAHETIELDITKEAEIIERYGDDPVKIMQATHASPEAFAEAMFSIARKMFLKDGYHDNFIFFLEGSKIVNMQGYAIADTQQKYLMMRHFADDLIRYGADGIIMICEAWTASSDELAPHQRPAELDTRGEALILDHVTKTSEPIHFEAKITRNGDQVSLGETIIHKAGAIYTFAPFYEAWKKPIPKEWTTKPSYKRDTINKD